MYITGLKKKMKESLTAVLPIMLIVVLLSVTVAPVPSGVLLAFLFGGALVIAGMMLFSLGAELAMETMGEKLGSRITKTKKLLLVLLLSFLLGFMVTISEPDLQVLANQVPAIPNQVLVISVAAGVGIFLVIAFLRMLMGIPLRDMLVLFYTAVLLLGLFASEDFLAIAYDSGGVTTGPMTVPFIMAYGIGISAIRSDRHAAEDSFGLVALCSVGPILAVMLLSLIYRPENLAYVPGWLPDAAHSVELGEMFLKAFPAYLKEIAVSLFPIVFFYMLFQLIVRDQERHVLIRIGAGVVYTYAGLVLFLTGVNVGFLPVGTLLGQTIAGFSCRFVIIPIGMLIGYFIVRAEPAIYVLMRQVEELTNGAISGKTLQTSLGISVSVSVGLALFRVLTGISIQYFMIPGYILALVLSFFTPKIFSAIAFDSGGVASGPMTATFLLPFAIGACLAVDGNVVTDAFGVVAMVAMTPLIMIQALGIVYRRKTRIRQQEVIAPEGAEEPDPYMIIEL